jgi:predicted nucleotide-binding protein
VVQGHDTGVKEAVARFLEKLALEPVILHEQANRGATVIEKFERHSSTVRFAIVLPTCDDVGGIAPDQLRPRARQNVVLELGFFVGALGRERVCAMVADEIELPSDIHGIVWTPIKSEWKMALAKELDAAGYSIDWNKVMRS